ncbi:S-adenosyl-L-methionine-dependent methyltransferase [Meredithblackwellia eburnea MCA 4105]
MSADSALPAKRHHSASPPPPSILEQVQSTNGSKTPTPTAQKKQRTNNKQTSKKIKKKKSKPPKPGGAEETGAFDVLEWLGRERVQELEKWIEEDDEGDCCELAAKEWGKGKDGKEVEVEVVGLSAHGDGLAILTPTLYPIPSPSSTSSSTSIATLQPVRLLTIPFTLPGERVLAHIHRHEPDPYFMSHADLVKIVRKSPMRDLEGEGNPEVEIGESDEQLKETQSKFGERVRCKYFGTCSGCQYQPLSYTTQLTLKQTVVRKAFANFSGLPPTQIPEIGPTLASPLQYGYRTKLTPHFQTPPAGFGKGKGKEGEGNEEEKREWEVTIGFEEKGRKRIVDIEECVIATKIINEKMKEERVKVKANISQFKRGATLLLRDSLPPRPSSFVLPAPGEPFTPEDHICITDHHATVREQVAGCEFEQMAGSFFQNNNSILGDLLDWVREALKGGPQPPSVEDGVDKPKRYLIDAYCGSGLFAVSLADQFDVVEGVEIDKASVKWAKKNAEFNQRPGRGEVGFRDGKAEAIFGTIDFPSDQTTILIDPPRKGCDELFLQQLLAFNPATVVYVSCNVHTQARDIGWLIKASEAKIEAEGKGKKGFWIESVRAADLFANTHHAEGVAILRREI